MDTATRCYIILNVLSGISATFTNFPILIAIWRNYRLHTPSFILIANLATADLGIGFLVQPMYAVYLSDKTNLKLWQAHQTFAMYFLGASIVTMAFIAVDRYVALALHLRYQQVVTSMRVSILTGCCWAMNTLFIGFYAFMNWFVFQIVVSVVTVTCILIVLVCYFNIFRIVRRHRRQITTQRALVNAPQQHGKSLRSMFYLHGFFVLSITPMSVCLVCALAQEKDIDIIWRGCVIFAQINSAVNPYLNIWRNNDLRKALVKIFRKPSQVEPFTTNTSDKFVGKKPFWLVSFHAALSKNVVVENGDCTTERNSGHPETSRI